LRKTNEKNLRAIVSAARMTKHCQKPTSKPMNATGFASGYYVTSKRVMFIEPDFPDAIAFGIEKVRLDEKS